MIFCGAYLLVGGPVFSVGPRDVLRMCCEEVRLLRAQGSPKGRRSHCGQWAGASLLLLISPVGILEHNLVSRYP